MIRTLACRAAALLLAAAAALPALAQPTRPTAPVRNVPETFFGITVDDPYRYFENVKDPEVAAWMKSHSEHAFATLKAIPGRDRLRQRIEQLDASAPARVNGVVRTPGGAWFYQKRGVGEDQFRLYVRQGAAGAERLLFDPETLKAATGQPHAINHFTPSPDGRWIALGISAAGSEEGALRVLDVASGRQVGPEIPRAQFGAVSWTPDSRQFFFHRMQELKPGMPPTEKYQRSSAVVMRPGDGEADLRTVLTAGSALGIPATEFAFIDVRPDGRVLLVAIDGVSPDFAAWHSTLAAVLAGRPDWQPLVRREDRVTALALHGERVYALSFREASRYKLVGGPLRGSGVFGRAWHEAGKQATKPNTWKDFIACAEWLIAQKWTQPAKLTIWGGSAGGILVGRAMTERPELFAAVVPSVGSPDMVRAETTSNGVPNIPEFGTRANEAGFRALLEMSTYHQIKDGVNYPAVLLTHGVNDPRVEVWTSTKTGARLLAASRSGKPVLLRLEYDSGHGIGNTKSQVFDEVADVYAFVLWQMGVPGYTPP